MKRRSLRSLKSREQKKDAPSSPSAKEPLANRLGDRRLAGPGEPVQPEDGRLVEVLGPRLDLVQDGLPCTPEAALAISVLISGSRSTAAVVQHR